MWSWCVDEKTGFPFREDVDGSFYALVASKKLGEFEDTDKQKWTWHAKTNKWTNSSGFSTPITFFKLSVLCSVRGDIVGKPLDVFKVGLRVDAFWHAKWFDNSDRYFRTSATRCLVIAFSQNTVLIKTAQNTIWTICDSFLDAINGCKLFRPAKLALFLSSPIL